MFESLFGKPNPTKNWPTYAGRPLTFDLDAAALNGVRLGDDLDRLEFLGPDQGGKAFRQGELCYYDLGVCLGWDDSQGKINCFQLVFRDQEEELYQRFAGEVEFRGQTNLDDLSLGSCQESLGEWYWRDDDEDETILFYEFSSCEWQLEFETTGALKRIITLREPVMADAAQREAYNVTKPWPPQF